MFVSDEEGGVVEPDVGFDGDAALGEGCVEGEGSPVCWVLLEVRRVIWEELRGDVGIEGE